MKKTLVLHILRGAVGLLFVFSGLVKLVDPVGTQIKMSEYFSEDVLNLTFLEPWSLELGIFLIVLELALGVWLLIGYHYKFTLRISMILMLFFLFLTGYSAVTGKVTDCGCFGDAVKLTPWETFYKNVVIFLFLLILWNYRKVFDFREAMWKKILAYGIPVLAVFFAGWTVKHLPVVDFRPYAVGKNIKQGMEIPPGAPEFKYEEIWYYKVDGKIKKFKTEDEPWNIPGAEFVKRETKEIQKGYIPPVHDFSIEGAGGDITEEVLKADDIWLILVTEPTALDSADFEKIKQAIDYFQKQGKKFVVISSDFTPEMEEMFAISWNVPVYLMDGTTLKTMIRTRVGVMHLQNATVKDKHTISDFLKDKKE